ncbi:hypothetical protein H311_01039 [Anncaliia algerae PRA109]|nr:hypothetical protein H311_01039 [Anncaliia algerae PRA109]
MFIFFIKYSFINCSTENDLYEIKSLVDLQLQTHLNQLRMTFKDKVQQFKEKTSKTKDKYVAESQLYNIRINEVVDFSKKIYDDLRELGDAIGINKKYTTDKINIPLLNLRKMPCDPQQRYIYPGTSTAFSGVSNMRIRPQGMNYLPSGAQFGSYPQNLSFMR